MNPTGPAERVTVARYDDDYPLALADATPRGESDAAADAGERAAVVRAEPEPIQVDLLDAWFKP